MLVVNHAGMIKLERGIGFLWCAGASGYFILDRDGIGANGGTKSCGTLRKI